MTLAIEKFGRMQEVLQDLPGKDCGACGAPNVPLSPKTSSWSGPLSETAITCRRPRGGATNELPALAQELNLKALTPSVPGGLGRH